jgi:hypothetical protein
VTSANNASNTALEELEDLSVRQGQVLFSDMLIARTDGSILVATNPEWERQISSFLVEDTYPIDALHTHPIHDDATIAPGALAILTHAPLRSGQTEPSAILIGVNADARLGALFEDMQIFWEQRGIYRVERGRTFALLPRLGIRARAQSNTLTPLETWCWRPLNGSPIGKWASWPSCHRKISLLK